MRGLTPIEHAVERPLARTSRIGRKASGDREDETSRVVGRLRARRHTEIRLCPTTASQGGVTLAAVSPLILPPGHCAVGRHPGTRHSGKQTTNSSARDAPETAAAAMTTDSPKRRSFEIRKRDAHGAHRTSIAADGPTDTYTGRIMAADPQLLDRVRLALALIPARIEEKRMFGGVAF